MRFEDVAAGLGRADKAVGVAGDPVGVRRGADRRDRRGRLPRGGMFLFPWGTPTQTSVRGILSGADDDGDGGAGVAILLVMANRDAVVAPLFRLAGHEQWPAIKIREMHHALEEHKIRVAVGHRAKVG